MMKTSKGKALRLDRQTVRRLGGGALQAAHGGAERNVSYVQQMCSAQGCRPPLTADCSGGVSLLFSCASLCGGTFCA